MTSPHTVTELELQPDSPDFNVHDGADTPRCGTYATICTQQATHMISTRCCDHHDASHGDAVVYCAQHFAYHLTEMLDVTVPGVLGGRFGDMVAAYGLIDDPIMVPVPADETVMMRDGCGRDMVDNAAAVIEACRERGDDETLDRSLVHVLTYLRDR